LLLTKSMAYIRYDTILPSGETSGVFVIGTDDGLINFDHGFVLYQKVRDWFESKTDEEVKKALGDALDLQGERLDYVCEGLFEEREKGEWNKPFEYEKQ